MALDIEKMAKRHEAAKEERSSGDFFDPQMGYTKLYVHPPCDPEDEFELTAGLNYIEYKIHYGVNGKTVVSLDPETNPILLHPRVIEYLAAREIEIDPERPCPVKEWLRTLDRDGQKESRAQSRYLWGVTPIAFAEKKGVWKPVETFRPSPYPCSFTVWDGIMNKLIEDPKYDPTNPDGATLVVLAKQKKDPKRKGDDKMNVKYDVDFDVETTRKPLALSKAQKAALSKAMEPGGDCDLFRVFSNLVKGYDEVEKIIEGVEEEEEEKEERKPGRGKPAPSPRRVAVEEDADEPEAEDEEPAEGAAEDGAEAEGEAEAEGGEGEEEAEGEGEEEVEDEGEGTGEELVVERPDGAPECYGLDIEPENPTCRACPFKAGCAGVLAVDVPADLPPKKPAAATVKAPSALPKSTAAAAPKPAAAAPKPAGTATTAKPGTAKPSTAAAKAPGSPKAPAKKEPEPEGLEDVEAELEALADKRTAAKTAAAKHGKK